MVVLEGRTAGWAASGRNGGFCSASLTHGLRNGLDRFPDEMPTLERLGRENLDAIEKTVGDLGIDCSFERTGELTVATAGWQADELRELPSLAARFGSELEWLDRDQVRAKVDSPTYVGGVLDRDGAAMVDPARLARGLRDACLRLGVRLHENTPVRELDGSDAGVRLATPYGEVLARQVALGTNAFRPLLRRWSALHRAGLGLRPGHRAALGRAARRHRLGRAARALRRREPVPLLPADRRRAHPLGRLRRRLPPGRPHRRAARAQTRRPSRVLAEHFFTTFPQLEGLRFTHAWGGVIDTCSRFSPFWGSALGGRVGYVAGYTGLGVGASRFGAQVMLDRLAGEQTERTELAMVRRKPVPFPPEPLRWAGIQLTRRALAKADARGGRRGPWLRALDAAGLGFDS